MKGVVFREFLDFLDARLGEERAEAVIAEGAPERGGAYAATGRYPFEELTALMGAACRQGGAPGRPIEIEALQEDFGGALGCAFARSHRRYFDAAPSLFDLLERVDGHIHVEVRALAPDAELPRIAVVSRDQRRLVLDYSSPRRLQRLAKGVIEAAAGHYGEAVEIAVEERPDAPDGWPTARLTIEKRAP